MAAGAPLTELHASMLPPGRPASPPPPPAAPPRLAWHFTLVTMLAAASAGLVLLVTQADSARAAPVAWAYLALAAAAGLALRAPAAWRLNLLGALLGAAVLTMGLGAVRLGWGLAAPSLPLLPVMVCALTAVAGWRLGAALAAAAAAMLTHVLLQQPLAALPPGWPPTGALLAGHLLALGAAVAAGVLLGRIVNEAVLSAHQREQRFSRLLALAADAYWEIDSDYRVVAASRHSAELDPQHAHGSLGLLPWDLPSFLCAPDTLDVLMADLETRAPFRDMPFGWRLRDGSQRAYLASGEPRFDERGIFKGYWGVARDVTAVQVAHAALEAVETRYRELFARIPTPLVLHRRGRVIDANAAALALLGHETLSGLLGADLLLAYEAGDSRETARRRADQLLALPDGAALPVMHARLQVNGRVLTVQDSAVRVPMPGGPGSLAIYVDVSERLAAEEAVRRSEAMLAHLVATSPDLITLTDLGTGRYAMVNKTFERVTGWRAVEAVGRTSLELGVWGSEAAREGFLQRLQQHGQVTDMAVDFTSRSGALVAMRVSAARFVMDRRDYLVINARDVSADERGRLERQAILDNASVGIAVTRDRRFVLANPYFEQMFGWAPGSIIGQGGDQVWPSSTDYAEVGQIVGPALARGQAVAVERACRRHDGSVFLARTSARAIDPARPAQGGTVWIIEDVTERRQAEQALARARDDAEAANRAKSNFLANTSHELRTPLNGMIGLARMARSSELSETLRRQYLDQIADNAQALAGIISDILDLSKIEAGKLQVEATAFDLCELLGSLEHAYQTLALARGLALRFEIDDSLRQPLDGAPGHVPGGAPGHVPGGHVRGDPLRVRQIVTNFLTNAIKFTERGQVHIHARRLDAERVRIEVRDSGPGIEPAVLRELFKPFTQADQSTTRRYGGTGLGLSICRELATLMGGQVGVDSEPGRGSQFWAVLPLPPQALPPAVAPAAAHSSASTSLAGARVLMVEDNAVNMMIAVAMLQSWGVHVEQASDGREAVAAVQRHAAAGRPFDAVLMDVQMPVMSGHEATRALRNLDAGRELPVIALTAAALVTEREEALRAGMDDFLTKPIDADKLHATLLRSRLIAARVGALAQPATPL